MGGFSIKYGTDSHTLIINVRYFKISELLNREFESVHLRLKRKRQLRGQQGTCGLLGQSLVKSYTWEAKARGQSSKETG